MRDVEWKRAGELAWVYLGNQHGPYIYLTDLTIRQDVPGNSVRADPVVAGPFENLDAAKVAYLMLFGDQVDA